MTSIFSWGRSIGFTLVLIKFIWSTDNRARKEKLFSSSKIIYTEQSGWRVSVCKAGITSTYISKFILGKLHAFFCSPFHSTKEARERQDSQAHGDRAGFQRDMTSMSRHRSKDFYLHRNSYLCGKSREFNLPSYLPREQFATSVIH